MTAATDGRRPRRILRGWLPLAAWLAVCAAALSALWSVDQPRFDPPPAHPSGWSEWVAERAVMDAVAGASRLLATVALGYLILACVAHVLTLTFGTAGMRRATGRLNPGPIAALAAVAVLGSSPLASALSTSSAPPGGSDDTASDPPVMVLAEDPGPTSTTPTTTTATTIAPSTTTPTTIAPSSAASLPSGTLPPSSTTTRPPSSTTTSSVAPQSIAPAATVPEEPEEPEEKEHTVVEGDNFWRIAEARVQQRIGRAPSDAEVRDYWLELIELNASQLVEPGNPNLLLPGQVLALPGA